MQLTKEAIIFDEKDWTSGIGVGTRTTPYKKLGGYSNATAFNPFRFPGYATPGFEPSPAANSEELTGSVVASTIKSGTEEIILGESGKIHYYNLISHALADTTGGTYPHQIASAQYGQDIIPYTYNSGGTETTSIFYAYTTASTVTNWNIGRHLLGPTGGAAWDDTFMTTIPATPLAAPYLSHDASLALPPVRMLVGQDNHLYIARGNLLHRYEGLNGTNGKFVPAVLTFPKNFVITSIERTPSSMAIAGMYGSLPGGAINGPAVVFTWDYTSNRISEEIPCDDNFVSTVFYWKNQLAVVTSGSQGHRGNARLKFLSGNRFVTVEELYGIGGTTDDRFIDNLSNQLLVNTGSSGIVGIGTPWENSFNGLHNIADRGTAVSYQPGWVKTSSLGGYLASTGTSNLLRYDQGYSVASFRSGVVELELPRNHVARILDVKVKFRGTASSGRNLALSLDYDYGASQQTFFSSQDVAAPLSKTFNLDTAGNHFKPFTALTLNMDWTAGGGSTSAPIISRIDVFYEIVKV